MVHDAIHSKYADGSHRRTETLRIPQSKKVKYCSQRRFSGDPKIQRALRSESMKKVRPATRTETMTIKHVHIQILDLSVAQIYELVIDYTASHHQPRTSGIRLLNILP